MYRMLAGECDYALHVGLTEAGLGSKGIVASAAGYRRPAAGRHRRYDSCVADAAAERGPHRRSDCLPADPAGRSSCGSFAPLVTACPGCGRTTSTFFQHLADQIQTYLRDADAGVARRATRVSRR